MEYKRRLSLAGIAVAALVLSAVYFLAPRAATAAPTVGPLFIADEVFAPVTASSCSGQSASSQTGRDLRDAVEAQDDAWRSSAIANGADSFVTLTVPTPSSANEVDAHPTPIVVPGAALTVNVSKTDVALAERYSTALNSWGTLDTPSYRDPYTPAWGTSASASTLQDCAPRPTHLYDGLSMPQPRMWNALHGSGSTFDAALFEFSRPVDTFGAWFGDLETRTDGEGEPAVVKLFDANGQVIFVGDVPTSTTDQTNTCGGPVQNTDQLGCGNQATRWIGFDQAGIQAAAMLVIVGDDDTCDATLPNAVDGDCRGFTEHLSWIGATVGVQDAELEVVKTASDGPFVIGETVDFTIQVSNVGDLPANSVVVDDGVPSGLSVQTASGTGWSCSTVDQDVVCSLDAPLAGNTAADEITITATVQAEMAETVTNTAVATHTVEGAEIEVSDDATVTRELSADLSATKTGQVDVDNSEITWTVTVENAGPDHATDVHVSDALPSGLTFSSSSGQGWTCQNVGADIDCDYEDDLASGASTELSFVTVASEPGQTFTNTAVVLSATPDPVEMNNSADADVLLPEPPPTTTTTTTVAPTTTTTTTTVAPTTTTEAAATSPNGSSQDVDGKKLAFTGLNGVQLPLLAGVLLAIGSSLALAAMWLRRNAIG